MTLQRCVSLPSRGSYVLTNAQVPAGCLQGDVVGTPSVCVDNLAAVDLEVSGGRVAAVYAAGQAARHTHARQVDLCGKMVLPTFADLHTHIGETGGGGGGWHRKGHVGHSLAAQRPVPCQASSAVPRVHPDAN